MLVASRRYEPFSASFRPGDCSDVRGTRPGWQRLFGDARPQQGASSADAVAHPIRANERACIQAEHDCDQALDLLPMGFIGCRHRERATDRVTPAGALPANRPATCSPCGSPIVPTHTCEIPRQTQASSDPQNNHDLGTIGDRCPAGRRRPLSRYRQPLPEAGAYCPLRCRSRYSVPHRTRAPTTPQRQETPAGPAWRSGDSGPGLPQLRRSDVPISGALAGWPANCDSGSYGAPNVLSRWPWPSASRHYAGNSVGDCRHPSRRHDALVGTRIESWYVGLFSGGYVTLRHGDGVERMYLTDGCRRL